MAEMTTAERRAQARKVGEALGLALLKRVGEELRDVPQIASPTVRALALNDLAAAYGVAIDRLFALGVLNGEATAPQAEAPG